MNLGLIYNIVLKGLIGNDINSISNELRISIYEFKTIIGIIRLKKSIINIISIRTINNELRRIVSAIPRRKIFFSEYIFIEVKLLPHTPPLTKPIPIPPSRPNDLKHIAVTIKPNDYKHIAIVCVVRMHIG